jgi:hypothetical protein
MSDFMPRGVMIFPCQLALRWSTGAFSSFASVVVGAGVSRFLKNRKLLPNSSIIVLFFLLPILLTEVY